MKDISGMRFGLLAAEEMVGKKGKHCLWRCRCDCGGEKIVPAAYLLNSHTKSCRCLYKESRKDCVTYRKDIIDNTSLSSIVASKQLSENNTSGYTGVCFDRRSNKWYAYINYQKKRYFLGYYNNIDDAISARKAGESQFHDQVIM